MYSIAKRCLFFVLIVATTGGCVMSEEVKRIQQIQQLKQRQKESMTTNLSGEQIFLRSCNSCHPGGQAGMGPKLDKVAAHFPDDASLKKFIRQGVGIMPPQPKEVLNDKELDNLVFYVRALELEGTKK